MASGALANVGKRRPYFFRFSAPGLHSNGPTGTALYRHRFRPGTCTMFDLMILRCWGQLGPEAGRLCPRYGSRQTDGVWRIAPRADATGCPACGCNVFLMVPAVPLCVILPIARSRKRRADRAVGMSPASETGAGSRALRRKARRWIPLLIARAVCEGFVPLIRGRTWGKEGTSGNGGRAGRSVRRGSRESSGASLSKHLKAIGAEKRGPLECGRLNAADSAPRTPESRPFRCEVGP
jgi:hypothetical protein